MQNAIRHEPILTIQDVAELLRCSKTHVCNLVAGKVPGVPQLAHVALGRRKLVRREWLEQWLEASKR
jgi:excisionase family DNA binding protein